MMLGLVHTAILVFQCIVFFENISEFGRIGNGMKVQPFASLLRYLVDILQHGGGWKDKLA